jgi:hypothetical protein
LINPPGIFYNLPILLPYPDFMCAVGEVYLSMERFEEALEVVGKNTEEKTGFCACSFSTGADL